jgi:hypothetical protein
MKEISMLHHRFIFNLATRFTIIGLSLGCLSAAVRGQGVVKTDQITINGEQADFGSGLHLLGTPTGGGSVKWEYSTVNGSLSAKATVQGTLYVDSLDPYCARLTIEFKNAAGTKLTAARVKDICGLGGGNANLSFNQLAINESFTSSELNSVFLRTNPLVNGAPIDVTSHNTGTSNAPGSKAHDVIINNGNTDFGRDPHVAGSPSTSASVQLTRDQGNVTGRVKGTLYWDSLFAGGCTRLIIDFENASGTNLNEKTIDRCGTGGNANDAGNKLAIDQSFTSGSLVQIHLRVGTLLQDGSFRNVVSKTFGWN